MKVNLYEPWTDENEEKALLSTLRSKWWACGPRVAELESMIKAHTGAEDAIGFNSATSAFHAIFDYFRGGKIGAVEMPSLTFVSVAHSVAHNGHQIKWRDVREDSPHVSPESPEGHAVISMDYAGVPCQYEGSAGLLVVDAAHSLGGYIKTGSVNTPVGSFGDATVFSFHAVKNIASCCGGMVVTWDIMLARHLREIRNFGFRRTPGDNKPWIRRCLSLIHI